MSTRFVSPALRIPLVAFAAMTCLGASQAPREVRPYFGEKFEEQQVTAWKYRQDYVEGILITGTERYISEVKKALELIETRDGRNWYYVRKHVRRITLTGHAGMDIGGGRFTSRESHEGSTEHLAGTIVHDAWHRELFVRGMPWEGEEAELFCLDRQNEFLTKLGAETVSPEEAVRSQYWKVDYWSRDW